MKAAIYSSTTLGRGGLTLQRRHGLGDERAHRKNSTASLQAAERGEESRDLHTSHDSSSVADPKRIQVPFLLQRYSEVAF